MEKGKGLILINYYIGYDSEQPLISSVCHSSLANWIDPKYIKLIKLNELSCYSRIRDSKQATEFSFTRFLVPYLNDYKGWAVFCDGDFLWIDDPSSLIQYCDPQYAVLCVHHKIEQKHLTSHKMNNKTQVWYPRKNWSSLMLINCEHELSRKLTPDVVNTAPASYLHQLDWAENAIGELPNTYNFLVGYYPAQNPIHALHFTDGTPIHPGYENCEFSDVWKNQLSSLINT